MSSNYRVVKLLKNHLYPTYQLHAFMTNDKTTTQDGLRLAALTTMEWLTHRLGEEVPPEWASLPHRRTISPRQMNSLATLRQYRTEKSAIYRQVL